MAQADQTIQNATFPTVRADINTNLAALFSANSGSTPPSVTVAFQDWVDTSGVSPLWKKRNASNNAWITLGTIDGNEIAFEGTLPDQTGNSGKYLSTNGTDASWLALAVGATLQTFITSTTYTVTAGKTSFLVFCTGGGGGGGGAQRDPDSTSIYGYGGGGGGGGTAVRMYTSAEMGSTATVTIGAAGAAGSATPGNGGTGGSTIFDPDGSGLTLTGAGGAGGLAISGGTARGGAGGSSTNSQFTINGQTGHSFVGGSIDTSSGGGVGGSSAWAGGRGRGGNGAATANTGGRAGTAGTAGGVFILEF